MTERRRRRRIGRRTPLLKRRRARRTFDFFALRVNQRRFVFVFTDVVETLQFVVFLPLHSANRRRNEFENESDFVFISSYRFWNQIWKKRNNEISFVFFSARWERKVFSPWFAVRSELNCAQFRCVDVATNNFQLKIEMTKIDEKRFFFDFTGWNEILFQVQVFDISNKTFAFVYCHRCERLNGNQIDFNEIFWQIFLRLSTSDQMKRNTSILHLVDIELPQLFDEKKDNLNIVFFFIDYMIIRTICCLRHNS